MYTPRQIYTQNPENVIPPLLISELMENERTLSVVLFAFTAEIRGLVLTQWEIFPRLLERFWKATCRNSSHHFFVIAVKLLLTKIVCACQKHCHGIMFPETVLFPCLLTFPLERRVYWLVKAVLLIKSRGSNTTHKPISSLELAR